MVSLRPMSELFSTSSAPSQANHGVAPGCGRGLKLARTAFFRQCRAVCQLRCRTTAYLAVLRSTRSSRANADNHPVKRGEDNRCSSRSANCRRYILRRGSMIGRGHWPRSF